MHTSILYFPENRKHPKLFDIFLLRQYMFFRSAQSRGWKKYDAVRSGPRGSWLWIVWRLLRKSGQIQKYTLFELIWELEFCCCICDRFKVEQGTGNTPIRIIVILYKQITLHSPIAKRSKNAMYVKFADFPIIFVQQEFQYCHIGQNLFWWDWNTSGDEMDWGLWAEHFLDDLVYILVYFKHSILWGSTPSIWSCKYL